MVRGSQQTLRSSFNGALNHVRVRASHEPYVVRLSGGLNYVELRPAMHPTWCMAEGVGFEPTGLSPSGFQDRRLKPLGHPSATDIIKYLHQALSFSP